MAENSKPTFAILGIITVACLGGAGVLWATMNAREADFKKELQVARMETTQAVQKLERAEKRALENVKPNIQPESVVSQGEYEALSEKLRALREELAQAQATAERYKKGFERNNEGMLAAAKLQGTLKKDLNEAKAKVKALEASIQTLKATNQKLLQDLVESQAKKIENLVPKERPTSLPSQKGSESSKSQSSFLSVESAKMVVLPKSDSNQDETEADLQSWIVSILESKDGKLKQLVQLAGDDARVAKAVAQHLRQPTLTVAALKFMDLASWWTFDRIVERAKSGLPRSDENIQLLGRIIHRKAKLENRDVQGDEFARGILGAAHIRYLASQPIHAVSTESFLSLIEVDDDPVAAEAKKAVLDSRRRHEWIAAVLDRRSAGKQYSPELEAFVWERLENSIATCVALAKQDPQVDAALRSRIPVWAKDKSDGVVRRVAMETLQLVSQGKKEDMELWNSTWVQVWPEFGDSKLTLLDWLSGTPSDRAMIKEVLSSPNFGCADGGHELLAPRARQAQLVRSLSTTSSQSPAFQEIWSKIIQQEQPLVLPLMVDALAVVPPMTAMEIATRLIQLNHKAGEDWFRTSLRDDYDRRMVTIERLFDIGTPTAHTIARSIVGQGDPRTTYRLVELGWEQDVDMPQEDIVQLLRSPFLDPVRIDVFMAYFERCLGDELTGLVTEALFDPSAVRPETLLDYLSLHPDQKLLPLISRYLESDRTHVREAALRALVPLELTSVLSNLLALIADEEPMVRLQLARCLGSLAGDEVARGGLLVLCKDKSAFVREASFDAMAVHNADKLLPALRSGVGDSVRDVAVAAAKSLIDIGYPDDAAYDLLFKSVEDKWLGIPTLKFLKKKQGQELKTRDEWRAWWASQGNK